MQDRVSLYPGRVKLLPVAGQENTYDMVRADSPTQEGTPLNKENLLKDATAALLGGDDSMTPDDAFNTLINLVKAANTNANTKVKAAVGSYTGTGTTFKKTFSLGFKPFLFIIMNTSRVSWGTDNGYTHGQMIWIEGVNTAINGSDGSISYDGEISFTASDSGINATGNTLHFNASNVKYAYLAFG